MSDKGKLFVVATPIGNLQDFTFRGVETLKTVHCIFAEDTRTSKKLINHYDIDTKLYSYHDHSSEKEIDRLLEILKDQFGGQILFWLSQTTMYQLQIEI